MLFNSLEFAVFFPVVTILFFLLPHAFRWPLLLVASCIFYMAFVPEYLLILFFLIVVDYLAALWIAKTEGRRKKAWLLVSIISTCLVLFVFKYFNFFQDNVEAVARALGWSHSPSALRLLLPIGLSFHTFQSLSYVIEVYRGHQEPERHFGIYSLYVMFYPQLVAGPIERPQNLLHQFREHHLFNYDQVTGGLKLMAWGFFKKLVIADRLALYVNPVYADPSLYPGPVLILATLAFAYQIYCDFSGYSDIAIGAARVMGFKLMTNFDSPYQAQSIGEFWKRWHISLSTWFRDYIYIPLGGSRVSKARWGFNIMIVFLLSGLWHGANWTYVIWGALNGFYLICGGLFEPLRQRFFSLSGWNRHSAGMVILRVVWTFTLVCVAWIFFRANTLSDAWYILTHSFSGFGAPWPAVGEFSRHDLTVALLAISLLEGVDWYRRSRSVGKALARRPLYLRWAIYYAFLFLILALAVYEQQQFIYFQF